LSVPNPYPCFFVRLLLDDVHILVSATVAVLPSLFLSSSQLLSLFPCPSFTVFALILETMLFHCLCLRHCFCSRFYLCLYRCLASVNVPPCMCLSCLVSIPVIVLYSCSLFYSAAVPLLTPMTNVPSCPPSCKTCLVASGGQASDLLGRGASATWGREVPGFEVASPGHGKGRRWG
jgi:hypothetical protein